MHWGSTQLSTMATVLDSLPGESPLLLPSLWRSRKSLVNVRPDVDASSVLNDFTSPPLAMAASGCKPRRWVRSAKVAPKGLDVGNRPRLGRGSESDGLR